MNQHAADLRRLWRRLLGDFRQWPAPGPRFVDEIACLAAVLLAIAAAHVLQVRNVGWAAFSAFIVLRGALNESARRAALRVLGTAAGAALACWLAPLLLGSLLVLSAALALAGAVTLYLALTARCGYGWLLAGLTFAMVLIDGMEQRTVALGDLAQSRFIEVSVGALAAVLVSAAAAAVLPSRAPAAPTRQPVAPRHAAWVTRCRAGWRWP